MTQRVGQCAEGLREFFDVGLGEGLAGQGEDLADHGAGVVEELAPEFAGFPPAVVAGVIAEAEEDGERDTDEGEGGCAEVEGDLEEVVVDRHGGDGDAEDQEQARQKLREDGAPPGQEHTEPVEVGADDHWRGLAFLTFGRWRYYRSGFGWFVCLLISGRAPRRQNPLFLINNPLMRRIILKMPRPLGPSHNIQVVRIIPIGNNNRMIPARHHNNIMILNGHRLVDIP
jgi:hypothetical protein